QLLHDRRDLPARRLFVELALEHCLGRVDLALHELAHLPREALHLVRRLEIHPAVPLQSTNGWQADPIRKPAYRLPDNPVAGLVPATHVLILSVRRKTWTAGPSP